MNQFESGQDSINFGAIGKNVQLPLTEKSFCKSKIFGRSIPDSIKFFLSRSIVSSAMYSCLTDLWVITTNVTDEKLNWDVAEDTETNKQSHTTRVIMLLLLDLKFIFINHYLFIQGAVCNG